MAAYNIETWLRGKVDYDIPDVTIMAILLDKEVAQGTDVSQLPETELEVLRQEARAMVQSRSFWAILWDSLPAIWVAGAAIMAALLCFVNIRFYASLRKHRRHLTVPGSKLRVYVADNIDTPCLFGFVKPAIYVTDAVSEDAVLLRHRQAAQGKAQEVDASGGVVFSGAERAGNQREDAHAQKRADKAIHQHDERLRDAKGDARKHKAEAEDAVADDHSRRREFGFFVHGQSPVSIRRAAFPWGDGRRADPRGTRGRRWRPSPGE